MYVRMRDANAATDKKTEEWVANAHLPVRTKLEAPYCSRTRVSTLKIRPAFYQERQQSSIIREDVNRSRFDFGEHVLVEMLDPRRRESMLPNTLTMRNGCAGGAQRQSSPPDDSRRLANVGWNDVLARAREALADKRRFHGAAVVQRHPKGTCAGRPRIRTRQHLVLEHDGCEVVDCHRRWHRRRRDGGMKSRGALRIGVIVNAAAAGEKAEATEWLVAGAPIGVGEPGFEPAHGVTFRRKGAGFFRHIGASIGRGERTSLRG